MLKNKLIAMGIAGIMGMSGIVPITNVDAMTAKVINKYQEGCSAYTAFKTSDGNLWIVDGHHWKKNRKYILVFDDKGTKDIEDDEIIKIIKY